jgi:hypothetical protein
MISELKIGGCVGRCAGTALLCAPKPELDDRVISSAPHTGCDDLGQQGEYMYQVESGGWKKGKMVPGKEKDRRAQRAPVR